jgi:hypothetical protein
MDSVPEHCIFDQENMQFIKPASFLLYLNNTIDYRKILVFSASLEHHRNLDILSTIFYR